MITEHIFVEARVFLAIEAVLKQPAQSLRRVIDANRLRKNFNFALFRHVDPSLGGRKLPDMGKIT